MAAAWWIIQLAEEAEENEKKSYLKIQRRQLRDTINPFDILKSQFLTLYW